MISCIYLHVHVYFSVCLENKKSPSLSILSLSCPLSTAFFLFQNYVKSLAFPGFVEKWLALDKVVGCTQTAYLL